MRVTAELSLYPLEDQYIDRIEAVIRALRAEAGLEIVVNQMSTQIRGELGEVMAAIEHVLAGSFADGGPQALVAKILNADLPIAEAPAV
jgi:uncharacterized protein YqgV (UPF0045/DUF77 family)